MGTYKMNNKGSISAIIAILVGVVAVSGTGVVLYNNYAPEELNLGAPVSNVTRNLLPATDAIYDVGTTSQTYNARFNDVTIDGTCTGCGSASLEGGFAGMMSAWFDGTTLISTSTLVGDTVQATSTATSTLPALNSSSISTAGLTVTGDLTHEGTGTSSIPTLLSTNLSTAGLTITGDLLHSGTGTSTFAGGVRATRLRATGSLTVGTDSIFTGTITVGSTGTSTIPLLGGTSADITNLLVSGDLNVTNGTSTLQGATFAGLYTTNGLHVDTGDALFDQKIVVAGTGTSTFAGTLDIQSDNGTTTLAGHLDIADSLRIGGAIYPNIASSTITSGTTTIAFDCSIASRWTAVIDKDARAIFKNCYGGQSLMMIIQAISEGGTNDSQIDWDGLPDANGEFGSTTLAWDNATSTVGYLSQGAFNICTALFATSSDNLTTFGIAECADRGYGFR